MRAFVYRMVYALYRRAYALYVFKRYDEEEVNAEPTCEAHAWQARVDVGPGSCVLSLNATHRCSLLLIVTHRCSLSLIVAHSAHYHSSLLIVN